uniref:Odorant binding protein 4 n=1 Tax=Drosicha corpulenta TaxID=535978 RepID=A0A0U3U137_9HEMI|nr:odorant binding protein 4 [Drosicha corpulenta]
MFMSYYVCLTLALITHLHQSQEANVDKLLPNWKEVIKTCGKNLNAQDATMILYTKFLPSNEDHKCFLECVYKMMGIIKDNKLNWEIGAKIAKQKFGEDVQKLTKLETAFNTCNEKVFIDTNEKCSIGRLLRDCFYSNPQTADFQKY